MTEALFQANLVIHYAMLVGVVFSIARPENRVWPPLKKQLW